jgi:hypothetical protein
VWLDLKLIPDETCAIFALYLASAWLYLRDTHLLEVALYLRAE